MARNKKRADGRVVITKTYNGKRKFFYGATGAEAERKQEAFEKEQAKNVYTSDILYEEWLDAWLDYIKDNLAKSTFDSYCGVVRIHIKPELGLYRLTELNPTLLREYFVRKREASLSPRSIEYIYTLVKSSLKLAVFDDVIEKNPMDKVPKPKVSRTKEIVALDQAQVKKLLETIATDEIQRLFRFAIATGLRRSELLGIRWADIDINHKTVSVAQTVLKVGSKTLISPTTKNASSRRTISLDDKTLALLKKQRLSVIESKLKTIDYVDYDLVFPGENGNPRNPDWVTKMARDYGKKAGLPKGFSFHSLRHTHATLLLKAGVHFKIVQSRLGHASFKQTMDTYSHVTPDLDCDVAKKIENMM